MTSAMDSELNTIT